MAEAIAFNVAASIITKLGSPAFKETMLLWGLKDEIEKLRMTVSTIQAVLLDAEEKYSKSHQVKNWVDLMKEAFYDADDLLDEISTKALQKQVMGGSRIVKEVRIFFSGSKQPVYALKIAHKIKNIRSKLDGIAANKNFYLDNKSFHLDEEKVVMGAETESHSSLPQVVVGREDDKKAVVGFLLSSNDRENVSVISIVGVGGLGKTTLAQIAWNDEMVSSHFELKLWACISNNFDVKLVLEKILESALGMKPKTLEMNTLKNLLHEKINGKKYLLVLDDLWNENSERWFQLKDLLDSGASGSRIIVTTRLKNVAEMIRSELVHELRGLGESESWSLFTEMAFKQGEVPSEEHERVGKEIVRKCVGVPLAIRAIGRLLYSKNISEWVCIKDKEMLNMNEVESILRLSYNHLPSHLKHCFAYCSLFPKSYRIHVLYLVELWMAQGYIRPLDPKQSLREIGYEYFKNLLWRSFFQEVEVDEFGEIEYCKMHDLIYDVAVSVAGEECCLLKSDEDLGIKGRTRHLGIDIEVNSFLQVSRFLHSSTTKVRSFVSFNGVRVSVKEEELHMIFANLKHARALDLHNIGIERVPQSLGKMKHLRFLYLSNNESIEMLPDSITKLLNLQVLYLSNCKRLKQLPKDIKKLINLTHLYIWGCVSLTHMPRGLGQLTSLERLSVFVLAENKHSGGLHELHALNNLRGKLCIMNLRYVRNPESEFETANLKEKQHLQTLTLAWKLEGSFDDNTDDDHNRNYEKSIEELRPHPNLKWLLVFGCGRLKFPSWISSLSNLVILRIDNCKIGQHFPPLDQFPHLKQMGINKLVDLEYMEVGMNYLNEEEMSLFFPSLEDLWLRNCPNLKGWRRDTSTPQLLQFQCLQYLEIESCLNLTSMPLIPTVQNLQLKNGSMKSMEDTLKIKISVPQSSTSSNSASHSQLKSLGIIKIEDLEYLSEELIRNLTSLQQLDIINCQRLKSLSDAIPHLTSLEVLIINACEELDLWDDGNQMGVQWQLIKSLGQFQIKNISKLVSLPKGLLKIPNLQKFLIRSCPNLMSLPDWMVDFSALKYLYIDEGCPELAKRCGNNKGADWPKIAHIPNIRIEGIWIQEDGCYKL